MPYVNNLGKENKCLLFEQLKCIYDKVYADKDTVFKNCKNECPLECDSSRFILKRSFSRYPTPRYADNLINSTFLKNIFLNYKSNTSLIHSSLLSFGVYYSDLIYTEINQLEKYSPFDLICNIGGTLGLFIGASVLSFFEIIETILNIFYIFYKYKIKPGATVKIASQNAL